MKATETIQEMNLEIMEGEARPAYLRETPREAVHRCS